MIGRAALQCGGAGPCRGHTAAPVALRRRCARRRAALCADRAAGSRGAELSGSLVPFGAVPGLRCSAFCLPLTLLAASRVAGFLGSRRRCRLRLLGIYSARMIQHVVDGVRACPHAFSANASPAPCIRFVLLVVFHTPLFDRIFSCFACKSPQADALVACNISKIPWGM